MTRSNETERAAHNRQASDPKVAEIATKLFTSIAQQSGVLTVNPEGDCWIELLCNTGRMEEEERGPLRSGARALAERCRLVADNVVDILNAVCKPLASTAPWVRYSCPDCGSTEVQLSFPVWVLANDIDDQQHWDLDVEASPEKDSDKGWCPHCATNVLVRKEAP